MSDSDGGEAPRRWSYSDRLRPRHPLQNIRVTIRRQQDLFERLSANLRDLDQLAEEHTELLDTLMDIDTDLPHMSARPPPGSTIVDANNSRDPEVPPPGFGLGPKSPITAFVSALPPTPYQEKRELEGSRRTLAYIQVQQKVLKYIKTQCPHELSARQARKWTQAIDDSGKNSPTATEALQLCYYMRARGFDVYNKLEDKAIHLYVVNQGSNMRDAKHDQLYWKQNIMTNKIDFTAPSPRRSTRRNAVHDNVSAFAELARTEPSNPSGNLNDRTTEQRAAMRVAEAELDRLLRSRNADPE